MNRVLIASIILSLAGCATPDPYANAGKAHYTVKPSTAHGAAYEIQLRNYENENINITNKDIRRATLDEAMENYCGDDGYTVTHEEVVAEGMLDRSKRRNNFYVYVRCN